MRTTIEPHLRSEEMSGDVLLVRGRPLDVVGLRVAAERARSEFSWRGLPLAAVSAEVTGTDRNIAELLAGPRLATRRTCAVAPVGTIVAGGFAVLPTFNAPHVSIVLPHYTETDVRNLVELLGPEQLNPYYRRTLR